MGLLSLLPLLIMLVMVITTKRIFESLLVSLAVVYIMKDGTGFLGGFIDSVYEVLAEETYPWILLMLALFGAFIQILVMSGGINGFRKVAKKYIRSEKSSLVFTWVLGVILFIDDYINNLGIGPTVRKITDEYGIPREQIGFSVCSTGTPECAMIPLTAFAVFNFSVMQDYGVSPENSNMISEYIKVVPFLFYPILILIVALLLGLGVIPRIGNMKKYYNELKTGSLEKAEVVAEDVDAAAGGDGVVSSAVEVAAKEEEAAANEKEGHIMDFVLPVIVLVGVMFYTNDLVISVIAALFVCFIYYIPTKKMKIDEYFKGFFDGVNDMTYILIIILMTFVFVKGLDQIGFTTYVLDTVTPYLSGGFIPVLTLLTVAALGFLGVDYWAVILLIAPISIPLASSFGVDQYLTMASIISGSVFGGTTCFFGEQVLMCSQAVERPPMRVALASLPYALIALVGAAVLYLIFGMTL